MKEKLIDFFNKVLNIKIEWKYTHMVKIIKKTLNEQIYEVLRDEILAQKISFGEKLVNKDLQNKFGVSSTPIRDAINRLYMDGLVDEISKTGAKIINFDLKFATEINEFICILCTSAVELSYQRGEKVKIVEILEKIIEKQKKVKNEEEYFQQDYMFHKTFFDFSDNIFLKETYKRYNVLRFLLSKYAYEKYSNKEAAISQHGEILEAYRKGEIQKAKDKMTEHCNFGIIKLNEFFSEKGEK